jgi:hypothetical protein
VQNVFLVEIGDGNAETKHLLGLIEGVGVPRKSEETVERIKGTSMFVSILLCVGEKVAKIDAIARESSS